MLDLILVVHCHQPVGNFHQVFVRAHEECYRPILDLLEAHPAVRCGLHFSGSLLEWLEAHRPETLALFGQLIDRGQVEALSGGFYEPLLADIPVEDAQGQVQMMNDYLTERFRQRPTGFWLAERIWDPTLPRILGGTGMQYTVVDDTHFAYAGLKPDQIFGRYVTEKEGHTLSLLATPMILRYLIPFRLVEDVMGHLRTMEREGRGVAVYGDDGEKFGLWPGTYEWVIQKGWLKNFFAELTENQDWVRTRLPGDYVAETPPLGRLYLPQASYEEMTEWALPPDQGQALEDVIDTLKREGRWEGWRPFVRGGIWDNFLVKYEESNRMHKKMLFLSPQTAESAPARQYLWQAQCNCAYWHGVFGGLYLGHLRRAIHERLLKAEAALAAESEAGPRLLRVDLDKDGAEEILVRGPEIGLGLEPERGGGLFEVAHMRRALNLSDTLTRRKEAYHRRLLERNLGGGADHQGVPSIHEQIMVKEEGLERLLVYDRYVRASLLDHFLEPDLTVEAYARNEYTELGDFVQGRFEVVHVAAGPDAAQVVLERQGLVQGRSAQVRKTILVGPGPAFNVAYVFQTTEAEARGLLYGCEFNLMLYSDQDPERYLLAPDRSERIAVSETGRTGDLTHFELINEPDGLRVVFTFSAPVSAWFFPLITVSMSEAGPEKSYQGSSLLFTRPLDLAPGHPESLEVTMRLEEI